LNGTPISPEREAKQEKGEEKEKREGGKGQRTVQRNWDSKTSPRARKVTMKPTFGTGKKQKGHQPDLNRSGKRRERGGALLTSQCPAAQYLVKMLVNLEPVGDNAEDEEEER
jgi:hypothetical protein